MIHVWQTLHVLFFNILLFLFFTFGIGSLFAEFGFMHSMLNFRDRRIEEKVGALLQ